MKKLTAIFSLLLFFIFPKNIQAARSLTIVSDKSSIFGDEEMVVTALPSGFIDDETIYVKGAFYQDAPTPNYFGYTQKGDSWVKNSQTTTDQLSVKMGEWDNNLKVKSDFSDSGYKGEEDYKFKVGFYYITSGGNLSSVQWSSNLLTININEPDPSPTPTPTPTPNPTNTPSPTVTPTKTPSTSLRTNSPTPTPTKSPTPKPTITSSLIPSPEELVLGIQNSTPTPQASPQEEVMGKKKFPVFPVILIVAGIICIAGAVFFFVKNNVKKDI